MQKQIISLWITLILLTMPGLMFAKDVQYNLLDSTPIGSWQLRENIETNHKGKVIGSTIRTSLLGSESRGDTNYFWIEIVMNSFKVNKKGKHKKQGDQMVMKALIPSSLLAGDPANVIGNLRGFGVETIIQSGDEEPMRITNSGDMMSSIMKSMNIEINYDFEDMGSDNVSVKAGNFKVTKIQGSGSTDSKVLFKKIHVESNSTAWISTKVPFGTVKTVGTTVMNGKKSNSKSELIEYGNSGATSLITGTPKDMPKMPKLFGN